MQLYKLLENVKVNRISGDKNVEVRGITYDSRKVKSGFVFVAIKGFEKDGHDFIQDAINRGAVAVISQKSICISPPTVFIHVEDSRQALAEISAAYYDYPFRKLKVIGVTGTNGKTTTTYLIKSILEEAGFKVGLIGTITNKIGQKELPSVRTTPESSDLYDLFSQMIKEGAEYAVMEVSSHSLELKRVYGCEFEVGVFTNLTQDHLDFHKTMENYFQAKRKLFYQSKKAAINIDDVSGKRLLTELKLPVYSYGIEENATVIARDIQINEFGIKFSVVTLDENTQISLKIPGKFSVYNALAAISCGLLLNIDLKTISTALKKQPGVPGRFELVDEKQEFAVIVDYAHTPDSLENILKTVRNFVRKRVILVFGCGGDRDRSKRPIMGEIGTKYSDVCIITSDNPRTENPESIIQEIEKGCKNASKNYIKITDRKKAIEYAITIAQPGDVVLIAGKGHETYQVIGDRVIPFDDRKIARQALRKR
ncbi:MAG: UDP-N-acetylmuramoyl-L-alanyl-D-glutamate--2,6-diaminopimelate ligase [Thermosediminibacterales bacterium]|nr:UDP-N-acetylmuramoyl-L-alanyl-D-glutamate--2,6-diaminopimelate ligase [Thermosediminibacterales bacterium]